MTHRATPRHRLPRRRDPFTTVALAALLLGVLAWLMLWVFGVI